MSKTESTTKPARTRRPSVAITNDARTLIDAVAADFKVPVAHVRTAASGIASEAIEAGLREYVGKTIVEAKRAELDRLEKAMGATAEPEVELEAVVS